MTAIHTALSLRDGRSVNATEPLFPSLEEDLTARLGRTYQDAVIDGDQDCDRYES